MNNMFGILEQINSKLPRLILNITPGISIRFTNLRISVFIIKVNLKIDLFIFSVVTFIYNINEFVDLICDNDFSGYESVHTTVNHFINPLDR
jgi:hypothetical protein